MKVIVPIYPADCQEQLLLERPVKGELLAYLVVNKICQLPEAEVHIFTPEKFPYDYSSLALKCHRFDIDEKREEDSMVWPRGARQCLEYLIKLGEDVSETYLIINYRSLDLTVDVLVAGYKEFSQNPGRPLCSVEIASDNPVQFISYYQFLTFDVIAFLDQRDYKTKMSPFVSSLVNGGRDMCFTKPVPFSWSEYGYPSDLGDNILFIRTIDGESFRYQPIDEGISAQDCRINMIDIYLKTGAEETQRLVDLNKVKDCQTHTVKGVSAFYQFKDMICLLAEHNESGSLELLFDKSSLDEKSYEIRLQPYTMSENLDNIKIITRQVCSTNLAESVLTFQGTEFYSLDCILDLPPETNAVGVTIVRRKIEGGADFSEPVSLPEFCSDVSDRDTRINNKTGKMITGRQSSPEFYQLNRAFIFSLLSDVSRVEKKVAAGECRAIRFESRMLRSSFDLLGLERREVNCAV